MVGEWGGEVVVRWGRAFRFSNACSLKSAPETALFAKLRVTLLISLQSCFAELLDRIHRPDSLSENTSDSGFQSLGLVCFGYVKDNVAFSAERIKFFGLIRAQRVYNKQAFAA